MENIDKIKKKVYEANKDLIKKKLVIQCFGNVSERFNNQCIIKPSGIDLHKINYKRMVSVNIIDGKYNGSYRPSSDTPTHLELYKKFNNIQSIVHTHSTFSTSWAQAGLPIPCLGTTHADNWSGDIPITRVLTKDEIEINYEKNTGLVIIETLVKLKIDPIEIPGILVNNHGVFTWGESSQNAVKNAQLLENISEMAYRSLALNPNLKSINTNLHAKHFNRKNGKNKYYGQN